MEAVAPTQVSPSNPTRFGGKKSMAIGFVILGVILIIVLAITISPGGVPGGVPDGRLNSK